MNVSRVLLSLAFATVIGGLAYQHGSLTRSGWLGAAVVGTVTAGLGGWEWGVLVIVFFVSSSALSRFGRRRKAQVAAQHWEKSDRRDWGQVMANGGLVSLLAALAWLWPSPLLWAGATGVLATVTGDTWATEIGVLSRRPPRLLTTGRVVDPGTSGGVTILGSTAALLGAATIGLAALVCEWLFRGAVQPLIVVAALVGGATGVAVDSLLGATVQAIRWCPHCQKETERRLHGCGTPTVPLRGWSWLNNDVVNAVSSIVGGLVACIVM